MVCKCQCLSLGLSLIYNAKITSNLWNYHEKIYYGTSEGTFEQRHGNHKKSLNHEKHRTDTKLSKEYWRHKELKAKPAVQFYILKRWRLTKRTGICYLCLNEKLFIIEHQRNNLLSQRNKLISKCRHKNKFKLMNYKTWPLCGKCLCSELISCANFLAHLDWIWRFTEYPHIHSECGIMGSDQPQMQIVFTQLTSEHCFVILMPLYCELTVISWLNDHEDIKLLLSTHVALFY